jgi:hypothetical protein
MNQYEEEDEFQNEFMKRILEEEAKVEKLKSIPTVALNKEQDVRRRSFHKVPDGDKNF